MGQHYRGTARMLIDEIEESLQPPAPSKLSDSTPTDLLDFPRAA